MRALQVRTAAGAYPILIERGLCARVSEHLPLKGRRVCVVTDSGVPTAYADAVAGACERAIRFTFPCGEENKTFNTLQGLLALLLKEHFDRSDAIVAVGGGVVSDLAGFAASIYMRGIDFYTVPTTLLSAVDASVGGKTAVDFEGYKNMIGAFWQPRAVLIDPETLNTLPRRRISDGLAEVVKMAATCDSELFEALEQAQLLPDAEDKPLPDDIDEIIARALAIKIRVVEQDEREGGLRRVLNFGHTLGHAIESCMGLGGLYHGECVALGMLPMCRDESNRARLSRVLERCGLPTVLPRGLDPYALTAALLHDKKAAGEEISAVFLERMGEFSFEKVKAAELAARLM